MSLDLPVVLAPDERGGVLDKRRPRVRWSRVRVVLIRQ